MSVVPFNATILKAIVQWCMTVPLVVFALQNSFKMYQIVFYRLNGERSPILEEASNVVSSMLWALRSSAISYADQVPTLRIISEVVFSTESEQVKKFTCLFSTVAV